MRIVHLSDIHVWRYSFHPLRLASKRALGMASLLAGRARRFRLERLASVVERVRQLAPDHLLITGDLTTTALHDEFRDVRQALSGLLRDPARATLIPGNHDRYTIRASHARRFEAAFGEFTSGGKYPWMRWLDGETAILALDATRPHLTAQGNIPAEQLARCRVLGGPEHPLPHRLIVASHYPMAAPARYASELRKKRVVNSGEVCAWLAGLGPHLYCCGHVHAAWAFTPDNLPGQLCLNAGAPLLRDPTGDRPPGFLQIDLVDDTVDVTHHAWTGSTWSIFPMVQGLRHFARRIESRDHSSGS